MSHTVHMLLVESSEADAQLIRRMLPNTAKTEYEVVEAATLAEALDAIADRDFDIILLDADLADCDGVQTVKTCHRAAQHTPIIVLTDGGERSGLACIEAGAHDYLD